MKSFLQEVKSFFINEPSRDSLSFNENEGVDLTLSLVDRQVQLRLFNTTAHLINRNK